MQPKTPTEPTTTDDSSYSYDQLIGGLEISIGERFGEELLAELLPESELLEGLTRTLDQEDEEIDIRVSARMVRFAFLNFLLIAHPETDVREICARLPLRNELTSPDLIVDQFARVIKGLAGLKSDLSQGWYVEPKVQRLIARLLPAFFRSYSQMGQDEALLEEALAGEDGVQLTYTPTYWSDEQSTLWNERWGTYADDFRYLVVASQRLGVLSQERASFAWLVLMRLVAAQANMEISAFACLVNMVVLECQDGTASDATRASDVSTLN